MANLIALHTESLTLDVLRFLVAALGGVVLGLTFFVFRVYLYAYRLRRRTGNLGNGAGPYHVALIASAHFLLVLAQIGVVINRFGGEPLVWWGAPISLIAFTMSIIALVNMLHYEQARIVSIQGHTSSDGR